MIRTQRVMTEPMSFGWTAIGQVHGCQRELLRHSLVALAAGGVEVGAC